MSRDHGTPPSERVQKEVAQSVKARGTKATAHRLEVSRETVARLAGGLSVLKTTAAFVEAAIRDGKLKEK